MGRSVISVNSMPWQARGKNGKKKGEKGKEKGEKGKKKGEKGKSRNKRLADDNPLRL